MHTHTPCKIKKERFNLRWSFLIGYNCSALGAKNFETPHNFKPGRGVYVKPVEERNMPQWKHDLWAYCKTLIRLIDADFAAGEYSVNFSCMNTPQHYVKKHTDSDDISYQYAFAVGSYSNAFLRCYDADDNVVGEFDYHRKVCKLDGRLSHELVSDGFEGERYCVIFFKTYDHLKSEPDPIFATPCFV